MITIPVCVEDSVHIGVLLEGTEQSEGFRASPQVSRRMFRGRLRNRA